MKLRARPKPLHHDSSQRRLERARNGILDGVGYRGHRRYYADLPYAADAVWVRRVGHLYDIGLDHGYVQRRRHSIVEQRRVHHRALVVHEVLFVERPSDALDSAALNLPFDVCRVDRGPDVLRRGVTK